MRCSRIGFECRMFRWCSWTWEFIRWHKMRSRLVIEDGVLSSWRCPCAQVVHEVSTERSFLGGEWECPPRCHWLRWLCSCIYPRDTPPQLWWRFVARGIAWIPSLHEKHAFPRCGQFSCLNFRGRLCRPGWWADLGESGKQRACLRWSIIANK